VGQRDLDTDEKIRTRAAWIARNVLPCEPAIRAWLRQNRVVDLDVDDVIQEMYTRIVSMESFEAIQNPKQYCFQIVHSVVVDHARRARIVSIYSVADVDDLGVAGQEADPEQNMSFREEIKRISDAVATMPERTRDVLMMRRVDGLSQRETASRLAVTEKTVEKHLARAVLMLMTRFGRGGKTPSPASFKTDKVRRKRAGNVRTD
jgi:RNA polymerase sigma factor (sigma-70 family)